MKKLRLALCAAALMTAACGDTNIYNITDPAAVETKTDTIIIEQAPGTYNLRQYSMSINPGSEAENTAVVCVPAFTGVHVDLVFGNAIAWRTGTNQHYGASEFVTTPQCKPSEESYVVRVEFRVSMMVEVETMAYILLSFDRSNEVRAIRFPVRISEKG